LRIGSDKSDQCDQKQKIFHGGPDWFFVGLKTDSNITIYLLRLKTGRNKNDSTPNRTNTSI